MQIRIAFIQCKETFELVVGNFGNKRIPGILKSGLNNPLYKDALIVIQTGGQHSQEYLKQSMCYSRK